MKTVNKLRQIRRFFFITQILVLFFSIFAIILFSAIDYLDYNIKAFISVLDYRLQTLVQYINATGKLPEKSELSNAYYTFIINQRDGSYIYRENNPARINDPLWESYEKKLIYQMQKQEHGIIFYPEKREYEIYKTLRGIKYTTLKEKGWIVAVEGYINSDLMQLKDIFSRKYFINICIVFMCGVVVLRLITLRYHHIMRKVITEHVENNLINFNDIGNNKVIPKTVYDDSWEADRGDGFKPVANIAQFEKVDKKFENEQDNIIQTTKINPFVDDAPVSNNVKDDINKDEHVPIPASNNKDEIISESMVSEKRSTEEPDNSVLEDLTIDISGIKSPLLKKMIKEMREDK